MSNKKSKSEFGEWFLAQFGPEPKRDIHKVRAELDTAQWKVASLRRELHVIEQRASDRRAALYAWTARDIKEQLRPAVPQAHTTCPACRGTGTQPLHSERRMTRCVPCKGTGLLPRKRR